MPSQFRVPCSGVAIRQAAQPVRVAAHTRLVTSRSAVTSASDRAQSQPQNETAAMAQVTATAQRSRRPLDSVSCTGGAASMPRALRPSQTRRRTKVPLVPPKPKLFFTARSMRISRATLAQ